MKLKLKRIFNILTDQFQRDLWIKEYYSKKCIKSLRKYRKCHKDNLFYNFEDILWEITKITSDDIVWKNKDEALADINKIFKSCSKKYNPFTNQSCIRSIKILMRKLGLDKKDL